jgi:hypothetical protein
MPLGFRNRRRSQRPDKLSGTTNPHNLVRATINGLRTTRNPEDVARYPSSGKAPSRFEVLRDYGKEN